MRSLTIEQLAMGYRNGTLNPIHVTESILESIHNHSDRDRIYSHVAEERALTQAKNAQSLFAKGIDFGPIQGVPIAIKENIDLAGEVTRAGSKVFLRQAPAARDARVLDALNRSGAIFLGHTSMPEFAYSGLGINSHFGTPASAIDPGRVPGGSSTGSGVAVAARLAVAALGTDTGGSSRIPAAANGIVGFKPTYNRLSMDGCAPLSSSLDTIGLLARSVNDTWCLFQALCEAEPKPLDPPRRSLTIAAAKVEDLPSTLDAETDDAYNLALRTLEKLGHNVVVTPIPAFRAVTSLYEAFGSLSGQELWETYEEVITANQAEIDPIVLERVLLSSRHSSSDRIRLLRGIKSIVDTFWVSMRDVDLLVCPTMPRLAPRFTEITDTEAYLQANRLMSQITRPFNLLGCPAVSVPVKVSAEALPIGFMLAARPNEDELVLSVADVVFKELAAAVS